jgi:hypothetical protein
MRGPAVSAAIDRESNTSHLGTRLAEKDVDAQAAGSGIGLVEALALLAKHVAFIHAGERVGRNRVAVELVAADIDRVLAAAGMRRRVDDRGDEWAELDGSPVMWLRHRPEVGRLAVWP